MGFGNAAAPRSAAPGWGPILSPFVLLQQRRFACVSSRCMRCMPSVGRIHPMRDSAAPRDWQRRSRTSMPMNAPDRPGADIIMSASSARSAPPAIHSGRNDRIRRFEPPQAHAYTPSHGDHMRWARARCCRAGFIARLSRAAVARRCATEPMRRFRRRTNPQR